MESPVATSVKKAMVKKVCGSAISSFPDMLSIEEPLEIRISYGPSDERKSKNISVTMRTPGNDMELATGFLFTEGIITSSNDIVKVFPVNTGCASQQKNIIQVELAENFEPDLQQPDRNFYTTSSCGVCGKASIQSIKTVSPFNQSNKPLVNVSTEVLYQLPCTLRAAQNNFSVTGGIHAAGLFSPEGELLLLREDVGRHNALDKLIGAACNNHWLPLSRHILLLSGRISFELVQKAVMAGISIIAAIGAPSSLAVELAAEFDISLFGFLKENRFNIYHSGEHFHLATSSEKEKAENYTATG